MRRVSNGRSAELVGIAQPIVRCGESRCERLWGQIAECGMWAVIVVVDDPTGERRPGMIEITEQRLIEADVAPKFYPAVRLFWRLGLALSAG